MVHELKTWTIYYNAIISGRKKFEVRLNDRRFQIGDTLELREWLPTSETYSGNSCRVLVLAVWSNLPGVNDMTCVMDIGKPFLITTI